MDIFDLEKINLLFYPKPGLFIRGMRSWSGYAVLEPPFSL